jgi:hypothetical protein
MFPVAARALSVKLDCAPGKALARHHARDAADLTSLRAKALIPH